MTAIAVDGCLPRFILERENAAVGVSSASLVLLCRRRPRQGSERYVPGKTTCVDRGGGRADGRWETPRLPREGENAAAGVFSASLLPACRSRRAQ